MWETKFDWLHLRDHGMDLVHVDSEIVVCGTAGEPNGTHPLLLWMTNNGVVSRAVVHGSGSGDSTSPGPLRGGRLHRDELGYVVVGSDDRPDVWLARYSHDGELVWETIYSAMVPRSGTNGATAMTLADGRIALFGEVDLTDEAPGFVAVFDEGVLTDEHFFAGPPVTRGSTYSNLTGLHAVRLSATDVLIAGGAFTTTGGAMPWMQRRKLFGAPVWELPVDIGSESREGTFTAMTVRPDGSVVAVAERVFEESELSDVEILALSADGEALWSYRYTGEYHRDDRPTGVASDLDGNAYVHLTVSDDGHSQPQNNHDLVLIKFDAAGDPQWQDSWSGPGSGDGLQSWDYSGGVIVDPDGFVLVTARTFTGANDYDVLVRKLAW
jgi:hypothetical protein